MRIGLRSVAAVVALSVGLSAVAQITIYHGSGSETAAMTLSPWGNGTIAETKDVAKDGANSIKVVTRGLYQGGIMSLKTPVDLKPSAADPNFLLDIQVAMAEGSSGGTSDTSPFPKQLRIVIAFDDGKMTEIYFPVYRSYHTAGRWHGYAVPVCKIPKFADSSGKLSAIGFYADIPATMYVGNIAVVNDSTPLNGEIYSQYTNIGREDEIPFAVSADAGDTQLKFYWDWDDKDGVQKDSEGPFVWHRFRNPGEYTVTLTIEDAFGVKKSFSTTVKITVNP